MRDAFPAEGTALQRYAARFGAVEINSSFHRPHRRATYERWAASVPPGFRFAAKLPKTITHGARLIDCDALLVKFADEVGGLGDRLGPILVQLPPSLALDAEVAASFFDRLAAVLPAAHACEPRHASWFTAEADALLAGHRVARVAADPARVPEAALPGGWRGLTYARWHGSPAMYRSSYDDAALAGHAGVARAEGESWTFYDNTTLGAATPNALALVDLLAP
ncbi:MAG: hypothetical protein JWN21_590 [Sphingomonas bacterium]|uniref:DUF72 domain-containing protein n=1 Tax=Sphingomonas bacterium TaxID=1895847 RepID=UPI00260C615C|nr:DUF72 domain-containing protein [Sphingomonas bacterium]MDB5695047.1 hypothetical protein [Sphingomonas bacterium]